VRRKQVPSRVHRGTGFYVVLRGPLGVGKTTVSTALSEALHGRRISIDAILEEHDLEEWDDDHITEASFLRVNDIVIAEALPRIDRGIPVVFDGNFYYRSQIDDLVGRLDFPHAAFTLKAPLSVCIARDLLRPVSYGEKGARQVFAKVSAVEYGIDVDACKPVSEVVSEISQRLRELAPIHGGSDGQLIVGGEPRAAAAPSHGRSPAGRPKAEGEGCTVKRLP
jgi:hypothetical protein